MRLALRPPCIPHERRQPCAVRLAALALCAGAPVLPVFRPFGALSWCGWYIVPARPRSRLVGRCFVPCFIWSIPAAPRSIGGRGGALPCPASNISAGGCLASLGRVAACVRINIRTAAGVSTNADAGTFPALITRPPLRRPSYILRGILAPFPCWCWCW